MAQERPVTSNRKPRPAGPRMAANASLTPKEVFGILRRHIFLMFFLTLLGLAAADPSIKQQTHPVCFDVDAVTTTS